MIRRKIKVLEIKELTAYYNQVKALEIKQSITIQRGDRLAVIGTNGAGKSTFVKSCLHLIPFSGKIETDLKQEDMAVHFQENNYSDIVSVQLIIEMILHTKIKMNSKLQDLIQFFDFEPHLKKRFKQLSGGQKQRLSLILVLMQDRPLTFFDEVTSGLDFETRMNLVNKIKKYYENKDAAVVFVSHYYEELEDLVNKILILEQGEVVCYGEPQSLFQQYCGKAVYVISRQDADRIDLSMYRQIAAPEHLVALSVQDKDELILIQFLIAHQVTFKRSEKDLELLAYNARREHLKQKAGEHHV